MRGRRCHRGRWTPYAAFGGGMLVCAVLPTAVLVYILAAALVLCGLSCSK